MIFGSIIISILALCLLAIGVEGQKEAKAIQVGDLYGLVGKDIAGDVDPANKCLKLTNKDKSVTIRVLAKCPDVLCRDGQTIAMTSAAYAKLGGSPSEMSKSVEWEWTSCPIPKDVIKGFVGNFLKPKQD